MKHPLDLNNKTILVTGSPGFIGANLVIRLLNLSGSRIISLDNFNDYYDPKLKEYRLSQIESTASSSEHILVRGDIANKEVVEQVFQTYNPSIVVNLAAQAGVRYSITNPEAYLKSNVIGFYNILEACRNHPVDHLLFASSSSVYGENAKVPFSVEDKTDSPVSFYAATKKSNELFAYSYSKLYNIPITGLRFFTVYGPAGRPDMFYFSAADRLVRGQKLKLFNYGNMKRDFTYIDDIVEGIVRVMSGAPSGTFGPPYAVYNIGGGTPENLLRFIEVLKDSLVSAGVLSEDFVLEDHIELIEMQAGDVPLTYADSGPLERDYGFTPKIGIEQGLGEFGKWYKKYLDSQKPEILGLPRPNIMKKSRY